VRLASAAALAAGLSLVVGAAATAESESVVLLGQPFALAEGESAVVDGALNVRFNSVVQDSRCPTDVQCVWAGNAEIMVEVAAAGEASATLALNTNPSFATEAAYLMYAIELIDLTPYPRTGSDAQPPYAAMLSVELGGAPPSLMPEASASPAARLDS
jgi:hypothetical protein